MKRDRQKQTSVHLTVQLSVVSSRMQNRRSWRKFITTLIRFWIIRFTLFIISILTGDS